MELMAGSSHLESENRLHAQLRMRKMVSDPIFVLLALAVYASAAVIIFPENFLSKFLAPKYLVLAFTAILFVTAISRYLGIFTEEQTDSRASTRASPEAVDPALLREIRNYLVHAPRLTDHAPGPSKHR
jgi:hypothetical protein